jgi:hypothetical protein
MGIVSPPVEGGCDDWELDYIITKHERYLEKTRELDTIELGTQLVGTMEQLAYLYKRKGDYKQAFELFNGAIELQKRRGSNYGIREYENQITELKKLLGEGDNE